MPLRADDEADFVARFGERARFDEPLAAHTWWKVGGPADAFIDVHDSDELAIVLARSFKRRLPFFIVGFGSNVLVGDGGMRGLVVRLGGAFSQLDVRDDGDAIVVRAGASASLALLTAQVASLGGVGVDGLAGIPATVGGAVAMNAGTDREIGEFVRTVRVQTPSQPDPHAVHVAFSYRHTSLDRNAVIADVELRFERGDPSLVRERLQARLVRRKATQPVNLPNAGSCFRNPPGDNAGRLIDAAGLKGQTVGGASVSAIHANFIVNLGGATAADIATLLARVRREVSERFGIALELEVHLVGEFVA